MNIIVEKLQDLINTFFDGSQKKCAKELDVSREYLNKILNREVNTTSPKICNSIILFCKNNNINAEDYIFFTDKCEKN